MQDYYITLDLADIPLFQQKKQGPHFRLGPDEPQSTASSSSKDADGLSRGAEGPKSEGIQILDLHGSNPIISYDGRVHSCKWASSLGTDMFFAKRDEGKPEKCLRSFQNFDLLGMGAARLIATNAQLTTKRSRLDPRNSVSTELEPDTQLSRPEKILKIDVPDSADPIRRDQADFLERLSQIKAERNEHDKVPVSAFRSMKPFGEAD